MEIYRSHTAQLVTEVLGVRPFLDEEQGALSLSELYSHDPHNDVVLDRELIYLSTLRSLARLRHEQHKTQPAMPLKNWRPTDAERETLLEVFEPERKHLAILNTFEPFVHDTFHHSRQLALRPYQEEDFTQPFLRFMTTTKTGESIQKSGYFNLPPSYGKSVLGVVVCKSIGIGEPQLPDSDRVRRALYATPSREAIEQMVGHFKRHAPELSVGAYYEETKSLDGDVLLTTYASARQLHKQGALDPASFSLAIFDEAHHLDGPQTFEMAETFAETGIRLGLTATPTTAAKRLLGKEIVHVGLRHAIETMGTANSVQIYATLSEESIFPDAGTRTHEDYAEGQIKHLISRHGRNAKILLWAQSEIERGHIGMIDCIPGERSRHARQLAAALSEMEVTDSETGQQRAIRALAVGNFQSEAQNADILQKLRQKEIDAVFTVSKATEAFDCPELNFIIKARPTKSLRNYIQMMGRGLRTLPGKPATTIIDIVDTVWDASQRQLTAFDVLKEPFVVQGLTIARQENFSEVTMEETARRTPMKGRANLYRPVPEVVIPDVLRQAIAKTDHTPVATFGVFNSKENAVELEAIDVIAESYDVPGPWARAILNHAGYRAEVSYRREEGKRISTLRYPRTVRDFLDEKLAPTGYETLPSLAEKMHITLAGLHARIKRLQDSEVIGDINSYYRRDTYVNCRPFLHCSPEQVQLITKDFNAKGEPLQAQPRNFVQVAAAANQLGIHRDYLMRYVKTWTNELVSLRSPDSNRTSQCVSQDFVQTLIAEVAENSKAKTTELLSLRSIAARMRNEKLATVDIVKATKAVGITPRPALRNGHLEATFTPEEVDTIVAACIERHMNQESRVKQKLGDQVTNLSVISANGRVSQHVVSTIINHYAALQNHVVADDGEIFGDYQAVRLISQCIHSTTVIPADWFELRDFAARAELDPDTLLAEIRNHYPEKSNLQNIYIPDGETLTYCSPALLLKAAGVLKKR